LFNFTPKSLGFQLANIWPKITGHDVYAMGRNGKEPENLDFSSVAATVEKAITYVFAERLIRNAEVWRFGSRSSNRNSSPKMRER
jgi:hypothetical protein